MPRAVSNEAASAANASSVVTCIFQNGGIAPCPFFHAAVVVCSMMG
jgi:hypothetical protein